MQNVWQLQDAKNKLSKVVDEALRHGPQTITRHGVEAVMVMSCDEYKKITEKKKKLSEVFGVSPFRGSDIDLSRDKRTTRAVNL